jgi:glycine cleavage system T protein (aminomethyltransferase)
MPRPTPFHTCTAPLSETHEWRNWSGYLAAGTYQVSYEYEYYAIRTTAALIDVSPLYKYEVRGPDAARLLDRVMTRNILNCRVGQVMYSPWCDDSGKIVDDGTVQRFAEDRFRVTAADSNLRWFQDCGYGMNIEVLDVSDELAALAIQGPNSRKILKAAIQGLDLDALGYFRLGEGSLAGIPLVVTRTGYTGDLGYEIWLGADSAPRLWEALMDAGEDFGVSAAGIIALDIARIEAGLLLIDVDYISSRKALISEQLSSPYEVGLGWCVDLDKPDFIGRQALLAEWESGSVWKFIGLDISWTALEELFGGADLPPQVAGRASRQSLPVFHQGKQIGQVTSSSFSPILKKYIAIGTVKTEFAEPGTELEMEVTVVYQRKRAAARVVDTPFYHPPWKKGGPR